MYLYIFWLVTTDTRHRVFSPKDDFLFIELCLEMDTQAGEPLQQETNLASEEMKSTVKYTPIAQHTHPNINVHTMQPYTDILHN